MSSPTSTAPHLRESVFRSYEPLIARAVSAFPAESSFTIPSDVAPTTFVANFRNAILSLKHYKWKTELVDCEKLWSLVGQYVISQDREGVVWFRHRGQRGRPNLLTSEARIHSPQIDSALSLVPWADATQEEIAALCLLIHTRRITGPVLIVGPVGDAQVTELTNLYDVGIVFHPDKNSTVIT